MAQPIFDDHPLQDYLRQAGDIFDPMPGAMSGLSCPFSDGCVDTPVHDIKLCLWLRAPTLRLAEFLNIVVTTVQNHHSTLQEFAERFKYDVISSSLLSSSITSPSSIRRRSSPSHDHVTALYYLESYTIVSAHLPDFIPPTFGALKDLIGAAHLWDSTVHEAISLLEIEENMIPSSPPSSPLRAALHAALLSTQTQSDNVRHVLVALTSPSSLAQLSEMYAPPSPMNPHMPLHARSGSVTAASRTPAISSPPSDKRATWNGSIPFSYAALADAGSPSRQSLKAWEKRRSDVSALLLRPSGAVMSAPTTPRRGGSLAGVEEEKANHLDLSGLPEQETDTGAAVPPEERGQFASAALELQRQRLSRGIDAFFPSTRSPPPKYTPISSQPSFSTHITRLGSKSSHSNPTSPHSSYSASRFTAMQIPRHPLSLHSLTHSLNGALAARRYASSHLLALRFGGGDSLNDSERTSESYWEDVRAVMELLTSALANATAPLIEALEATECERLRAEKPTPSTSHSRSTSSESAVQAHQQQEHRQYRRSSTHFASFAPLPSHLARFAAHVEALTNSLNDARDHLESCVASLRDGNATAANATRAHHHAPENSDPRAMHAYERLRRELGLALRECERGREPLLELLRPPSADEDEEDEEDGVPALGPDAESSDSDKDAAHARTPSPSPVPFSLSPSSSALRSAVLLREKQQQGREQQEVDEEDDVAHGHDRERGLLVVGLEHLPSPGIEQVFEADPDADDGAPRLTRPRSKLSRAERIAAAKARRASASANALLGSILHGDNDDGEDSLVSTGGEKRWGGPGGDVVQELKDVIWKVGEQRRLREEAAEAEQLDKMQHLVAQADAAMPATNGTIRATREPVTTADTSPLPSPPSPS